MLVDINLLPGKARERSKAVIASVIVLFAAVALWLTLYVMTDRNTAEQARADQQAEQLRNEQEALQSRIRGTETMADRAKLQETVNWAEAYRFRTAPLLKTLISMLPVRGFFTDFTFAAPHSAVVSVQFDTYEQAAQYLSRLKSSSLVAAASLTDVSAAQMEGTEEDETEQTIRLGTELPRYQATYQIDFVDERAEAAGTAEQPEGEAADDTGTVPDEPAENAEEDENPASPEESNPDNAQDPDGTNQPEAEEDVDV